MTRGEPHHLSETEHSDKRHFYDDDGYLQFTVLVDDDGANRGKRYAYRPRELIIHKDWARGNELVDEFVWTEEARAQSGDYQVVPLREGIELDIPEVVDAIEKRTKLRDADGSRRDPQSPVFVSPHIVFLPQEHGPWGPFGPPRPAPRPLPNLPSPQESQPGYGITVAVVDTGVYRAHTWWDGRVQSSPDDEETNPKVDPHTGHNPTAFGHGTFGAGMVLRAAPGARVVCRRVAGRFGEVDDQKLAQVLDELVESDVDIVNLSLGGYGRYEEQPPCINAALDRLLNRQRPVVVVACAGNDSTNEPFHPAAHPKVIGVGAIEQSGERAGFSNYGPWVDAYALGVNLSSAFPDWHVAWGVPPENPKRIAWATWSGTSFAAPVVCGMIAATARPGGAADRGMDVLDAREHVVRKASKRPQDLGMLIESRFVVS